MMYNTVSVIFLVPFLASLNHALTTFPVNYNITINPDLDNLNFTSETIISIQVEETIENVTLNFKNLIISDPIKITNSKAEEVTNILLNEENETLVFHFQNPLAPDLYLVNIISRGKINTNLEGFYQVETQNKKIFLTNFHYTKARQVFPCFDHPNFLSTFTLTLTHPKNYKSVASSVKISETDIDQATVKSVFAQSDPLPPHLFAFAIHDLAQVKYEEVSVITRDRNETEYLGQWSKTVLYHFQQNEPYRIEKLDQIVIPDSGLSQDVVVNVGLIFYRESVVFYNTERETLEDKQEIGKLVAGAVVRQWYKYANTTKWWSNLWISEGISSLYQFNILENYWKWRVFEQFLIQELEDTFDYDANIGITTSVANPDDFSQFHKIKSFALVRMFLHLSQPGDILEDDNVMALSWTQKPGFPVVEVKRNANIFTLKQTGVSSIPITVVFSIPISVVFQDETDLSYDLILEESSQQANLSMSESWYIVNYDRYGYFRTNYDNDNWQKLIVLLQNSNIDKISPLNRAALIQDSFNLAKSNLLSYDIYLELTKYLKKETDYIPIYAFIKTANRLKALFAETNIQNTFMEHARNLVQHMYNKIGTSLTPLDTHLDTLSRIKILTWLCDFGLDSCRKEMFEKLSQGKGVEPDLQELVYCGGMRLGTLETFMFLKEQHNKHKKNRILKSMACTSDIGLLRNYSLAIVDDNIILRLNPEFKLSALKAIIDGSDAGVNVILDVVKKYLEYILKSFTVEEIAEIFISLSKKLVTEEQNAKIDEIVACLDNDQKVAYGKIFETVKINIKENIAWRKTHLDVFRKWLKVDESTTTSTTTTTTTTESTTPGGAAALKISLFSCLMYLCLFVLF
ncbi:glutamyl aminopeptidase-like [Tribolium madens]|uniref:glutamyl aminopeptidase-like n=1 Tax=Tribolium madens TaxID=41895 RepID=UPI001CF74843|nr:glutamyl aminopeptidase-like [Tribolium madens]